MMTNRAHSILSELSKSLKIPGLEFDDQQMCTILIDGTHRVTLLVNSDSQLLLYGILGCLPDGSADNAPRDLLTANMLLAQASGPHLGLDPLSNSVILVKSLSLDSLTVARLEAEIEAMTCHQERMNELLTDLNINLGSVS